MTDECISLLRQRMIEDMSLRNFGEKTQKDYIRAVKNLTIFLQRSPDTASNEDLRLFQLHLTANRVGASTINGTVTALRFFFTVTLDRTDVIKHLTFVLERAAHHEGTAFVEVYQDCNIFNHEAFLYASDKTIKADHILYLEHGKPLVFGKDVKKGIRLNGMHPEIVELGKGINEDDLLAAAEGWARAGRGVVASSA